MKQLHLDFETYSELDIKRCGVYKHASHPTTEALMLSWKIDQGMTHLWDIAGGEEFPERLKIALFNPATTLHAFNATFERLIFEKVLSISLPLSRWRCTMCRAYSLAFNGGLDDVLSQFLPHLSKDPRGAKLIAKFSRPQPKNQKVARWTYENASEEYEEFKHYCTQDTEVEYALDQALSQYPYLQSEHDLYALDQLINDRGVPVDSTLIRQAIALSTREKARLLEDLTVLTQLDNPNSNDQLRKWLSEEGLELPDMQKDTLTEALARTDLPLPVASALQMKQQLAKTSVTKWTAFRRCTGEDNRVRGMVQFCGAQRTNRWAGRIVQLQNLARGGNTTRDPLTLAEVIREQGYDMTRLLYSDVLMALSDCIRCAITAPEGKLLNISDLSSIESRVVGWLADCATINQTFAEGRDTYKVFATELYHVPYEQVTKQQRNFSKPAVLGGAYRLGVDGLIGYAEGMGISMDKEESTRCIKVFREDLFPEIPEFWKWCKSAVFHTTLTGGTYEGPHGIRSEAFGEFLFLVLPSGRRIAYHKPAIQMRKAPWGEMVDTFTFMGVDKYSKKWTRISAHDGFITENLVQAIARDVLAVWMVRAHEAGFTVIGHVHDELICEEEGDRLQELNALIREPISWAPGLLLDAGGFVTKRYYKD